MACEALQGAHGGRHRAARGFVRGYGGSTGTPTEPGLIADGEAAYKFAAARYSAKQIVVWGYSLGSGVAVRLAAAHPVAKLVLEAPYTSAADVAAARFPLIAGAMADARSVPFARLRQGRACAAADPAWRAGSRGADRIREGDVRGGERAENGWYASPKASTPISTVSASPRSCGASFRSELADFGFARILVRGGLAGECLLHGFDRAGFDSGIAGQGWRSPDGIRRRASLRECASSARRRAAISCRRRNNPRSRDG